MRSLPTTLVVLAAVSGGARANPKPKPAAAPPASDCYLRNNADHAVRLDDHVLGIGASVIVHAATTLEDGAQTLQLACQAQDEQLKLVGAAGALRVERLPAWFAVAGVGNDGAVSVVATKAGAVVEVDGVRVPLRRGRGVQPIEVPTRPLAVDPAVGDDGSPWRVLVTVTATAGRERASEVVAVEVPTAMRTALAELAAAGTKPVAWAAAPDHAGPAIVFGCPRPTFRPPITSPYVVGDKGGVVYGAPDHALVRSPASLSALALVATCTSVPVTVETCPISKDPYFKAEDRAHRDRVDGHLTVVEARTGKVVATTTLAGGTPAPCHDASIGAIYGAPPTSDAITAWLDGVK